MIRPTLPQNLPCEEKGTYPPFHRCTAFLESSQIPPKARLYLYVSRGSNLLCQFYVSVLSAHVLLRAVFQHIRMGDEAVWLTKTLAAAISHQYEEIFAWISVYYKEQCQAI